jgi:hypothetical protein
MAQTRQQKELIVLVALVVVAAAIWYGYYGPRAKESRGLSSNGTYTPINAQGFGKILDGLEKTQGTEYKSSGRNIFVMMAMPVETAAGPARKVDLFRNQGPQPPPPPPPADLPMIFFGYGMLPSGGPRQAFLKEQTSDDVHIVSEGDLLLNHIKILHIGNERLDFEDINTGQKGSKALDIGPGGPA